MIVNVLLYLPEFIFKETECCCTYSKNPDLPVLGPPLACGRCPEVGLRAPDNPCGTITVTREHGVFRNMCSEGSVGWCGAGTRHLPPTTDSPAISRPPPQRWRRLWRSRPTPVAPPAPLVPGQLCATLLEMKPSGVCYPQLFAMSPQAKHPCRPLWDIHAAPCQSCAHGLVCFPAKLSDA